MRDVRQYWQEIRTIQSTLPEFVWLASGGCIVQVSAPQAARLLHAKSHRLATEAEIEAHHAAEEAQKLQNFHASLRRRGIAVVPV
jgi:hypothetical protein